MAALPAPDTLTPLRDYLLNAGIDADHLAFQLSRYLEVRPAPTDDLFTDLDSDHQAWAYLESIQDFYQIIYREPKAGEGNGENLEEPAI